jgi:flagellar biosynthesis protein FlhG
MAERASPGLSIAITSGKGGVGKTCVAANLAWALRQSGKRVLVVDADLGLANLDVLCNLSPTVTLHDVLLGTCPLEAAILVGPGGIHVLPTGSGQSEHTHVTRELQERFPIVMACLRGLYDYLLMDTGAGIADVVQYMTGLAQDVLLVATPEPTSFTDAYAAIKVMATQQGRSRFYVVMNRVAHPQEGRRLAEQLQQVADRFLGPRLGRRVSLVYLGAIPSDTSVERSVCRRQLVAAYAPSSPAARAFTAVAASLDAGGPFQPIG